MTRPTNLIYMESMYEGWFAELCDSKGYIVAKVIAPERWDIKGREVYEIIPVGGESIAGAVVVGVKEPAMDVTTWFDGTTEEFLDSLASYKERQTQWLREQNEALAKALSGDMS